MEKAKIKKRTRSEDRKRGGGRARSVERNKQNRKSTPGVTLKRVNHPSLSRRSPQRNRDRSDSDSTPHRRQRSMSGETLCRVKPTTLTIVNIFQDEDLFEEVRLGPQQTFKRATEKPRIRLNRVTMAAKNEESKTSTPNAKEPKFQNPNIFAKDLEK